MLLIISSAPAKAFSYISPPVFPFLLRPRAEPGPKFPTAMLYDELASDDVQRRAPASVALSRGVSRALVALSNQHLVQVV